MIIDHDFILFNHHVNRLKINIFFFILSIKN